MAAVRTFIAETAQRHSIQYLEKLSMDLPFGVLIVIIIIMFLKG